MAWFCNHYICPRCDYTWTDEWSCMCDDQCPTCGLSNLSPTDSDDLTVIVEAGDDGYFVVLRSPDAAGHDPEYVQVAVLGGRDEARAFADRLTAQSLDTADVLKTRS